MMVALIESIGHLLQTAILSRLNFQVDFISYFRDLNPGGFCYKKYVLNRQSYSLNFFGYNE